MPRGGSARVGSVDPPRPMEPQGSLHSGLRQTGDLPAGSTRLGSLAVLMQGPLGMCLVGSTMNQDLETLMALERAHILANYTQVRPRGDPST